MAELERNAVLPKSCERTSGERGVMIISSLFQSRWSYGKRSSWKTSKAAPVSLAILKMRNVSSSH